MSQVDVIIPAYNCAHLLPRAVESVLAQTEQDWHIVIVDDGSLDDPLNALEPLLDRLGRRLTVIRQDNKGPAAARNIAIRNSSSPFIAFLDADDIWLPNRLADSLSSFTHYPEVALSYGGISRFDEHDTMLDTFVSDHLGDGKRVVRQLYTRELHLPCLSVTLRRASLSSVGQFDETLQATEDRDLWIRVAQRYRIAFIPRVLALYRCATTSTSGNLPRMLASQKQFVNKHYGQPGCGWLARRSALGSIYGQQAEEYANRLQLLVAVRHACHAVVLTPFKVGILRMALSIWLRLLGLRFGTTRQ